jgi:hypothetical protein
MYPAALPSRHGSLHFNASTCINLRPDCTPRLHINNNDGKLPLCLPSSSSSRVTSLLEVLCMYVRRNQCLLCALKLCGGDNIQMYTNAPSRAKPCPQHARMHRIASLHGIESQTCPRERAIRSLLVPTTALLSISEDISHQSQPCNPSTLSVVD